MKTYTVEYIDGYYPNTLIKVCVTKEAAERELEAAIVAHMKEWRFDRDYSSKSHEIVEHESE